MIFQLRHPVGVLAIGLALVVGLLAHDAAQVLAAQAFGDPGPRRRGRLGASLASRADAFGTIGGVLLGYGWASPVEMDERWRARRRRLALALAAGPVAYLVLCFATAALLRTAAGHAELARGLLLAAYTFAALFVLSLIPTPPLDGGRILFALAPQTLGWQKAKYQLVERNIGVAIAFGILILPLLTRIPSVVGQLAADLLNPVGQVAYHQGSMLGDASSLLGVP